MTERIFCVLQSYQTLFVGLLGFTGVILTMLENAKLQRNQHEKKLLHEANSLRVAIKSELSANKQAYELRIKQFNEPEGHSDALLPNKATDKIYNELLSNIGLLTEEEIEKIINAYALISELSYRLRILVGTDNVGGYNNEFIRVKGGNLEIALQMHESILPEIIHAINTVEKHLKTA